jgi:hypothetical protein
MLIEDTYDPRDPRTRDRDRNQYGFFVAICLICCVCIGLVVLVVFLVAATNNGNGNGNGGGGATFVCTSFSDLSQSQQLVVSDCDRGLEATGTCITNVPGATLGQCRVTQLTGGTSTAPTAAAQVCFVPIADCIDGCQCVGEDVRVCVRDVAGFPNGAVFECIETSPPPTPPPGALRCGAFSQRSVVAQEESTSCTELAFASGSCNTAARCVPVLFFNDTDVPGFPGGITSAFLANDLACTSNECNTVADAGDLCACPTPIGATCEVTAIGTTGAELTGSFECVSPGVIASVKNSARVPLSKAEVAALFAKQ